MSEKIQADRETIRGLVSQIVENFEKERASDAVSGPEHIVVNSLKAAHEREFDRDESAKALITELDLRGLDEGSRIRLAENVKFTPLAADIIKDKNIAIVTKSSRNANIVVKSVAVGADHGGFETKEKLKEHLSALGLSVRDFGTNSKDAVDYPDIAHAVARSVADKHVDIGIMVDGAGIGSAMAANKVPGVRAAACYTPQLAKNAREHNGANVLTLGSGQNSFDEIAAIIEAFITTDITEERHKKRVKKIVNIDDQYREY
jgi:ribose 5-phosphate isomerase B